MAARTAGKILPITRDKIQPITRDKTRPTSGMTGVGARAATAYWGRWAAGYAGGSAPMAARTYSKPPEIG
jgi:hypothetical protein